MQDINNEVRKLKQTITSETEWIQYNDTELKFVPGNWPGVIERCIENNFYPKVLFYEKLHDPEYDVRYKPQQSFQLTRSKLSELTVLAENLDKLATADMEDLYDKDEIEN